jgi:hypothetical protein
MVMKYVLHLCVQGVQPSCAYVTVMSESSLCDSARQPQFASGMIDEFRTTGNPQQSLLGYEYWKAATSSIWEEVCRWLVLAVKLFEKSWHCFTRERHQRDVENSSKRSE